MTILVSSVGDTFVNVLQKETKKEIGEDTPPEDVTEVPAATGEVDLGCVHGNSRGFPAQGAEPGLRTEAELADHVQNKLPQDLVMLSGKLMK